MLEQPVTHVLAMWSVAALLVIAAVVMMRRYVRRPSLEDRNSSYDRDTVEVMTRVLARDSNAVDIGAHAGDILRHMVAIAPDGRHHAFEPLPHLADELKRRFPAAHVHQLAVSDGSGTSAFHFVENDPGYSGLRRRIYDRPDPKIRTLEVTTARLDDVIPGEQPIAFVKIDIEGGEYHALKGAMGLIRRWRPVIVFEAGSKSTGQYGVEPDDVYALCVTDLPYELSTMRRWLDGKPPYSQDDFRRAWTRGDEYYFLAAPRA
jgi:FkbM family methyltransferase